MVWSKLEIARLLVQAATPVAVAILGVYLTRLAKRFEHVQWRGCGFWDLIQPSFMFMVGVALPYSIASRRAKGQTYGWMIFHAVWRSLLLVLLAVSTISMLAQDEFDSFGFEERKEYYQIIEQNVDRLSRLDGRLGLGKRRPRQAVALRGGDRQRFGGG